MHDSQGRESGEGKDKGRVGQGSMAQGRAGQGTGQGMDEAVEIKRQTWIIISFTPFGQI